MLSSTELFVSVETAVEAGRLEVAAASVEGDSTELAATDVACVLARALDVGKGQAGVDGSEDLGSVLGRPEAALTGFTTRPNENSKRNSAKHDWKYRPLGTDLVDKFEFICSVA